MGLTFDNDTQRKVFQRVVEKLPSLIDEKCNGYDELYGYKLNGKTGNQDEIDKYYDAIIAEALIAKLCKAYQYEYETVVSKIVDILSWRREFNPLSAAFQETHHQDLQKIGILTDYKKGGEANKKVVTWNLYGQLIQKKELFKDVKRFLRYRIGLMERGLRLLDFQDPTNDYMTQVHDYKNVSMWRMDSEMKQCTKKVIATFQDYYPELLYAKYFVNVPSVLAWIYDLIKQFVDEKTRKKFVVMGDSRKLGQNYLKEAPSKQYGGNDGKHDIYGQNVTDVRPTPYGQYLLERSIVNEIE